VLLFADDTTLIATGKNLAQLVNFVNDELKKISTWFRANQMVLHPNKTKFTIFHAKPNTIPWDDIHIFIDENEPDSLNQDPSFKKSLSYINHKSDVPAIKFLGVSTLTQPLISNIISLKFITSFPKDFLYLEEQKMYLLLKL